MSKKNIALITAAGESTRFSNGDKLFYDIACGNCFRPLVYFTINAFEVNERISEIYIVTSEINRDRFLELRNKYFTKIKNIIIGGKRRQDSVRNGLEGMTAHADDVVIIENGCNPLVSQNEIDACIEALQRYDGALTYKRAVYPCGIAKDGFLDYALPRDNMIMRSTPQAFRYGLLRRLHDEHQNEESLSGFADDSELVLAYSNAKIKLVESGPDNIKVTHDKDVLLLDKKLN